MTATATNGLTHVKSGPIQHGGNQHAIRKRLGLGDRALVDFSVSLNPLGPPRGAMESARRAVDRAFEYPIPGCPRLIEALAERHHVPAQNLIIGSGTTELISLIAQAMRESLNRQARDMGDSKRPLAHLFEPSYGEYRRASVLNELRPYVWKRHILGWDLDELPQSAMGIFWTGNPSSPIGRGWERDTLLGQVDAAENLLVVADEAYLPFLRDEAARTVIGAVPERSNLVVLRSVTKVYAIPGLRIGYAVARVELVNRLRQFQNPWSVDSPSEAGLLAALDDDEYLERTIELMETESGRFTDDLWQMRSVRPAWPGPERPADAPPRPNWVLVSLVETRWNSIQVQEELARRGFYVRECSNFQGLEIGSVLTGPNLSVETRGHLRFAVRTRAENNRLMATLAEILASRPPQA